MGDDDSTLWGGDLGCCEIGYSPKFLELSFSPSCRVANRLG